LAQPPKISTRKADAKQAHTDANAAALQARAKLFFYYLAMFSGLFF